MRMPILCMILPMLLALAACLPTQAFEDVNVLNVQEKISAGEDVFVLDVRQPEEYMRGYIPGAYLIPLGELERRLDEIPQDKEILIACASGARSRVAAQLLTEQGHPRVFNVLGGTSAWERLPAQLHLKAADLRVLLPNPDVLLLDVRSAAEHSQEHITGAMSLPAGLVRAQPPDVPKNLPIIIIAATTEGGDLVAQELLELGYTKVLVLEGGMTAWSETASVSSRGRWLTTWVDLKRGAAL